MNFFDEILSKNGSHISSNAYLICESASNNQIFKKEKSSSLLAYVRSINEGFSSGKNLKVSIAKLLNFLPQCPPSVLSSEGERWMRFCSLRLKHAESAEVKALLTIMTFLLRACHENKELFNKITKQNGNFLDTLYAVDSEVRKYTFDCLYEFLRLYPSQSLPHKKKLEGKLMPVLSVPLRSHDAEEVYSAAKVYSALPVPGGVSSVAEVKGCHLDQLISLAHCAADALFRSVKETEKYIFPRDHKLPVKTLNSVKELNDHMVRILKSAPLLGNCFVFLKGFLEKCPFRFVSVKAKEILRLVFRILQVEVASLRERTSMELTALAFILPSVHTRAMALLQTLIENNVCGMFMNLVEEQVVSTLKAATTSSVPKLKKEDPSSPKIPQQLNTSLRVLCYDTLALAIKTSKGNHKGLLEGLLPTLLQDISPVKDSVSLKSAIRGGRLSLLNVKKKSKKKGYTVTSDGGQAAQDDVFTSKIIEQCIPVTAASLKLVEALFLYAHHSNELKYIKILHDYLMDLLNTRRVGVYKDPEVRRCLFGAINAYALYPHPMCPPSYSALCHALGREVEQDSHPMVTEVCIRGLSCLSFISSNPNTVNWSDVVRLKKDSLKVRLDEDDDEPLMNGHVENEDDMLDEDEEEELDSEEPIQEGDGDKEEESESDVDMERNSEDEEEEREKDITENGVESSDDEGDDESAMEEEEAIEDAEEEEVSENEAEECEAEEDVENLDSDEDEVAEENLDSDEDEVAEENLDSDEDEEVIETLDSNEDAEDENDKSLSRNESGSAESEVEIKKDLLKNKRRSRGKDNRITKRTKMDQEEAPNSLAEMLATFVDADPDEDSD